MKQISLLATIFTVFSRSRETSGTKLIDLSWSRIIESLPSFCFACDDETGDPIELDIGDIGVGGSVFVSESGNVAVSLDDIGKIEFSSSGISFEGSSNAGGGNVGGLFSLDFPKDTVVTEGSALLMTQFFLQQLKAAQAISEENIFKSSVQYSDCDLFPVTACSQGCCNMHKECYEHRNCDVTSWLRSFCETILLEGLNGEIDLGVMGKLYCTSDLLYVSGLCSQCNTIAMSCIASGCSGIEDPFTDLTCYDSECDQSYECPGVCDAGDDIDSSGCCGCKSPGETCDAPDSCGNLVCDNDETVTICPVDCMFHTCDDPSKVECKGVCINSNNANQHCGACGNQCPDDDTCAFGRCSKSIKLDWLLSDKGVTDKDIYGWQISDDELTITFVIEDSMNCNGTNSNTQSGNATAFITTLDDYQLFYNMDGNAELQDANYEKLNLTLDGEHIMTAHAEGGNLMCAMGPPVVVTTQENPSGPFLLPAGEHIFEASFTTNDGLFHVDGFYRLHLSFSPV